MKNGESVKRVVEETVAHYIHMAERQHDRKFTMPKITYFHTGRTGGQATPARWEVSFNTGLLQDNLQHYMTRTIPHEVAHLIGYALNGFERTANGRYIIHGAKFKEQMRAFGCETTRGHNMDTSKVERKKRTTTKHPVKCACGWTGTIGTVRKNKMANGTKYRHKNGCPPITLI